MGIFHFLPPKSSLHFESVWGGPAAPVPPAAGGIKVYPSVRIKQRARCFYVGGMFKDFQHVLCGFQLTVSIGRSEWSTSHKSLDGVRMVTWQIGHPLTDGSGTCGPWETATGIGRSSLISGHRRSGPDPSPGFWWPGANGAPGRYVAGRSLPKSCTVHDSASCLWVLILMKVSGAKSQWRGSPFYSYAIPTLHD